MVIEYLNTDLELESTDDLEALAEEFETLGCFALHVSRTSNGLWQANFETGASFATPEACINAILNAVEQLTAARRIDWDRCKKREFNIGIRSGAKPPSLALQLSNAVLQRIAQAGAAVGLTIYGDEAPTSTETTLVEMKVEPKAKADQAKLNLALKALMLEDPSFRVFVDQESGETILRGTSDTHLDAIVDLLQHSHKVDVNTGAPQVAYRETLDGATDIDFTYKKQTGGIDQFARVKLKLEPSETGKGNEFTSSIIDSSIPDEYISSVEKGIRSVWENGVLIGFPMVDIKVDLCDGTFHEASSSALAFETAARLAMKEGCEKAGVKLLEPIMDVEVVTPLDFVGAIIGDMNVRRGQIFNQVMRGKATVIRAHVPLSKLFGYAEKLRSLTADQAKHTMKFSHYADVPSSRGPDDFPPAIRMRL